jgi:hypothetical protein
MDGLAGLWPYFGQLVAMQVRAWLVARPPARLLLMQLGRWGWRQCCSSESRNTACQRGARHRYVSQWRSTSIFLTIDLRGAIRR